MADETMKKEVDYYTNRRYSRTLEEAFGPYARGTLVEPDANTRRKSDRKAVIVSAIAALFVIIFAFKAAV